MRRRPVYVTTADASIHGVNTTPLIDVLLVLLIIFIISLPAMSHKLPIDLPKPGPSNAQPIVHKLHIASGGALSWDGAAIAETSLPARLASVRDHANAVLALSASGDARYEDYDRVLATVKRAGISRLGLLDNRGFVSELDR